MKFHIQRNFPVHSFNKHWQFSVGGCHAALALRSDYTRQLKFIHDELGMRYMRMHGIFNDDMHTLTNLKQILPFPDGERFKERTFYRCGQVYDNILACGMKPFVELSFMPAALSENPEHGEAFYGSIFTLPKDFDEWADYIKAFIRYLIHRYTAVEVENWYFEVWNEPDLKGMFFSGTQQDYFKLYEVTARAIKSVNKKLRVGGPSTSGSKWISSFVNFCKQNNVPIDFVSTHQYAGDPFIGIKDKGGPDIVEAKAEQSVEEVADESHGDIRAIFSSMNLFAGLAHDTTILDAMRHVFGDPTETQDMPNNTFRVNSSIVKQQAAGLPLFYTEWNLNAIFTASTNDTRKVATYDVKTALDVENNLTGSSIWCFSDIFEELHQFPQEFHGGFGMQTIHGIPKPLFYALKMLAKAGDERIDLGENATDGEIGIAAFKSDNETQVLLFRQKMKNLELPKEPAIVSIEQPKAPKAVILERIDEDHCNPLKIWQEQGCPEELNQVEVAQIIKQSAMIEEELPYDYSGGCVSFIVELGVNDIYFIRIINE